MRKISLLILLMLFTYFVSSCKKKQEEAAPLGQYDSGVIITNEGQFNGGTGTVSFYNRNDKSVQVDVFQDVNQYPLGNIVQSINMINSKAYIVVNNANKIEVVDAGSFKSAGVITGFTSPRYFLPISNDLAYVSEWGTGGLNASIKVVNMASNLIVKTIAIGRKGAEKMYKKGDNVYVACGGGYGEDSVIAVINTLSNQWVKNIEVGVNPISIVEDINGSLWVLCKGEYKSKSGSLVKINGVTGVVESKFVFSSLISQPSSLCLNAEKNTLYFNYDGKIISQDVNGASLTNQVVASRSFYSLGIDPTTNIIYAGDAGNYSSNGKVIRYMPSGEKIDSFNVGVIPGSFFFR
jgi:hypothetical protein